MALFLAAAQQNESLSVSAIDINGNIHMLKIKHMLMHFSELRHLVSRGRPVYISEAHELGPNDWMLMESEWENTEDSPNWDHELQCEGREKQILSSQVFL